jgi:hypothetical protein
MSLSVQTYLETHTFAELTEEFGIKCVFHDTLPYVKLNYDQIESPKMHPIVMECRGLCLDTRTNQIMGKAFTRFFNYGEALEITGKFKWDGKISTYEKVDGSLMVMFFDPINFQWMVTTRGSFAEANITEGAPVWSELFFDTLKKIVGSNLDLTFNRNLSYTFELCSLYNKVVREYRQPTIFLLSIHIDRYEWDQIDVDKFAKQENIPRPIRFNFKNLDEVQYFITSQQETDQTFEGVVLLDETGLRMKIKSPTYVALHQLKGNGNIFATKHLLPFVLSGETDELKVYFPEVTEKVDELQRQIDWYLTILHILWNTTKDIENQKDFALAIMGKTPFTNLLFNLRKAGGDLETSFRSNPDMIVKVLKCED